jgi:DNA-binding NtrC family response regulator
LRVFVVDDEHVIATTVAAILQMNGLSATAFTSPLQALSSARSDSPDLLISDVLMPEMSGVDLALRIREECPNCGVLLFSGQAETSDLLSKARHLGYDFHLLTKPIHPTDLLSEVRKKLNPSACLATNGVQSRTDGGLSVTQAKRRPLEAIPWQRSILNRQ